jgi:hypothetical protein
MVDPRLLDSSATQSPNGRRSGFVRRWLIRLGVASVITVLLAFLACDFGPIWAPTLEGYVVDAETGEPVANAVVMSNYNYEHRHHWDNRWAATDDHGRFTIPGHFAMLWGCSTFLADVDGPNVGIAHRLYGIQSGSHSYLPRGEWPDNRALRFQIQRHPNPFPHKWDGTGICDGFEDADCDRICEIVFGEICEGYR